MDKLTKEFHVRWMIRRDMPMVLEIEKNFERFAIGQDEIIHFLRQRNMVGMVAVDEHEDIYGYIIYAIHKQFYNIVRFVTMPNTPGVDAALFEKLRGKLNPPRRSLIRIYIAESDLPQQLLFQSLGFRAMTICKDWYCDPDEDAYLMQYQILPNGEKL